MTNGPSAPESASETETEHFLDDLDVNNALDQMLKEFATETDRGAVLIAADIVSENLARSFRELVGATLGRKKVNELLNYPGILSTLQARSDVARIAGHISQKTHDSISILRKIRNNAAHSQKLAIRDPQAGAATRAR